MLVLALQFSRCAQHDVEAHEHRWNPTELACLRDAAAAGLDEPMLGVEGNSLKTEEKTRPAGRCMPRGKPAIAMLRTTDPIVHQLGVSRAGSHNGEQQTR